ncbi:MAG: cell wall hydrolase [Clostridiales bacterium]|nr:cell wall hydrolase [Clostridiales bacterium]
MKKRAASLLLAILAVVSLILPALAETSDEVFEEIPTESPETEEVTSAIVLDGEPVQAVEYEMRNGVCYVTVSSFVSMLDAEAMVEEANGAVTVNASTVIDVVPVESAGAEGEEAGEPEVEYAADVVTADLDFIAGAEASYLVANGRYLYVKGGLSWLNGRIAAPVRQLARVFNLAVDYDAGTGQVLLAHVEGAEPYLASGETAYDRDMVIWLARIIHAESGNQSLEGKIAVGNVVMNRVSDPKFPNTLYDVLFQKNQFSPAATGSIYREPNEESMVAAMLVLDGAQVVPEALFFNGAGARSYASKNKTYVATIGGHDFYK